LRDNSSEEEVLRRIKSQWLEEKKQLQSHYIIYNQNSENLPSQVVDIHNILTKKNSLI
jgi:dephospho-CoA kinase